MVAKVESHTAGMAGQGIVIREDYPQATEIAKSYYKTHGGKSAREPGAKILNLKDNGRVGGKAGWQEI